MTISPNKQYNLQANNSNVGTWGLNLNSNFSIIDNNLGGTLALNVGGSSNVALTSAQAQNLIHNLTGVLTGNINYQFPAAGGFFAINNQTSGAHNLTATVAGGAGGVIIPQGTTQTVYIDATVPAVYSFTGSASTYSAVAVGGTANALTVSATVPASFTLVNPVLILFTPTVFNTVAGPTLNVNGTGAIKIQSVGPIGLVDLPAGGLAPGSPIIAAYNGSVWIALNFLYAGVLVPEASNFAVDASSLFNTYYSTANVVATITRTTNLFSFWSIELCAVGGSITVTPNVNDSINNQPNGDSFVMPQGTSAKLETNANGKLLLNFCAANIANAQLANMPNTTIKANLSGTSDSPRDNFLTDIIDASFGNAQGSLLYRGFTSWVRLAPGTSGQVLTTQGSGSNPLWAAVSTPFSNSYASAAQAFGGGTLLTLAHGLGGIPSLFQILGSCVTGELGYSAGDLVVLNPGGDANGGAFGFSIVPDATNINVRVGGGGFIVINKSTGAQSNVTPGNWRLIVRAWI